MSTASVPITCVEQRNSSLRLQGFQLMLSMHLLPQDAPDGHLPISIIGDGNCFPRTVSVLTLGTESHHVEMRVRIIIEMAVNFIMYIDPIFLSKGSADDGTTLLAFLQKYADVPYDAVRSPVETLKEEIMRVAALGTECSMWHLFATANMLSLPLQSIFPDKGPIELQHLTKRILLPEKQVGPQVRIMWTSHREDQSDEYWAPTHFVPLLPLHPNSNDTPVVESDEEDEVDLANTAFTSSEGLPASLDSFFRLKWEDNKDYICEVLEVCQRENLVRVQFFTKKGSLFLRTSPPDVSWEDWDFVVANSKKVSLMLSEKYSTQRQQLFTVSD